MMLVCCVKFCPWTFCQPYWVEFLVKPSVRLQFQTNKVIKFDNLKSRILIEILTSESESETLKLFRKGVALTFPCFFGVAKFWDIFNTPKSLPNWPSLDQSCTICEPDVIDV